MRKLYYYNEDMVVEFQRNIFYLAQQKKKEHNIPQE
jgi:CRISPR/Cas system-associated endonuclease Cas1